MKNNVLGFIKKGLAACGLGPVVLAVVYLVLYNQGIIDTLSVVEVCKGIFSLTALAFIAGGINVIYQIEKIPLVISILIHGLVLYVGYFVTYIINGWLLAGTEPILIFSVIFVLFYLIIWAFIYGVTKKNTNKLNEKLKKNQQI